MQNQPSFDLSPRCVSAGFLKILIVFFALFALTGRSFADPRSGTATPKAFSLVLTNGYGDVYRMNLLRNRDNYQAYRGICSYRGFSLSGCSTTGEVVMLRIKATPSMPEHFSLLSTSLRWGTTMYVLNDVFRPLCSWVSAGYENWYPFDMSCSVAMYINSGGYGLQGSTLYDEPMPANSPFSIMKPEDRAGLFGFGKPFSGATPKAFSLVLTNGYGDVYRMNLLRNRDNYQAYRGICSYRGFSLSGCSTTGEVVMLRIKATPSMPEHFSLVSTSLRWGTTMYFLNDVFRPLCSWVMAGYENWYPFDMSCSVAMYINSGGLGAQPFRPEPITAKRSSAPFAADNGTGTNLVGALLPLTGDLGDYGRAYQAALNMALRDITNTPGMPPIRLIIADTQTDAGIAYDKLVEMRSNGVHIVLGPESSEECRILKMYANENDVLLLSDSSTAVGLAIPNDNLMRLTIDDTNQARELAKLLAADGITDIAILSRSDIYGDGMLSALIQEFNARGGTVFATNYCPRATDLIPETVSNMATQVSDRSALKGQNRVGVVTILFDEGVDVMQTAAECPAMGEVRWYGTDGMAQNSSLLENVTNAAFAAKTHYVCSALGSYTNQLYGVVESNVSAETGSEIIQNYSMYSYDALWLAAKALQQTGGTQTMATLVSTIRSVASDYSGCTGPIIFNGADDRSTGTYDFYEVTGNNGAYAWSNLAGRAPSVPCNVNASDGACSDNFVVVWNSVSQAGGYEVWGALSNDPGSAVKLASVSDTVYELSGVQPDTLCWFWVKAVNDYGTSAFSEGDSGYVANSSGPHIRVNLSNGPVTVQASDRIKATIQMEPGVYLGQNRDWWVVANTPVGWYYLDSFLQWRAYAGALAPAYQGSLFVLPATTVLDMTGLPAGSYAFYFGVDAMDGSLNPDQLWYDSVQMTVLE